MKRDLTYRFCIVAMLVIMCVLVGCCKQESEHPPVERKWLVVTRDGEFEDSINVTGWTPGEDMITLENELNIPWHGEDSIDYRSEPGLLWVNGKVIGVLLDRVDFKDIQHPEDVLMVISTKNNPEEFKRFKSLEIINLITYRFSHTEFKKLKEINTRYKLSILHSTLKCNT